MSPEVRSGHIDRASDERCGWANGYRDCCVPDCRFPDARCICVQQTRPDPASRPLVVSAGRGDKQKEEG